MDNILHRIAQIADNEKTTISKIEQKIGASKGVLYKAIQKNSDIQSKWVIAIVNNFPQYSSEWLLTGKGKMIKNNITSGINQSITGDSNVMSGGKAKVLSVNSDKVEILESQLKDCKVQLAEKEKIIREKDKTIAKLVDIISKK